MLNCILNWSNNTIAREKMQNNNADSLHIFDAIGAAQMMKCVAQIMFNFFLHISIYTYFNMYEKCNSVQLPLVEK